jgi:hypothetical protein
MQIRWLYKETQTEENIVYLRNRKDRVEETNTIGKINYIQRKLQERNWIQNKYDAYLSAGNKTFLKLCSIDNTIENTIYDM